MKKLMFHIFVILISIFQTNSIIAQDFEPPVIIDPPNPVVGDSIRVGLFHTFYPPCLILPMENLNNETHLFEFDDNYISLTVISINTPLCNSFPVSPAPREFYELGKLAKGTYTLQTSWVSQFIPLPVPPNINPSLFGQQIIFSVTEPIVIDAISIFGLIFLTNFVLVITFLNSKNNNKTQEKFS